MSIYFLSKKSYALIAAGIVSIVIAIFVMFWILVPPVPTKITIATGAPSGLYHQFGLRLQAELQKENIQVELKTTGGSVDNLKLLSDPKSGVQLGFVQTGVANSEDKSNLVSLAGVFYEPFWVWYRKDAIGNGTTRLQSFNSLKGKRIAIGQVGSGSAVLVLNLIKLHGLKPEDFMISYDSPDLASEKLVRGEIDAACYVVGIEAPILEKFYKIPNIDVMNFDEAEAYTRSLTYLSKVSLPYGLVSIGYDQPTSDTRLISPTAMLVASKGISPALISITMQKLYDITKNFSRLQTTGEFPSNLNLDIDQDDDAANYMREGQPSFLYRYLPFWLAVWVGRLLKIMIPLLAIGLPLANYLPSIINLKLKVRMAKAYFELKKIEEEATPLFFGESDIDKLLRLQEKINQFELEANQMKIPAMQTDSFFNLKQNIVTLSDRLRNRLNEIQGK